MKEESAAEILTSLRRVMQGRIYLGQAMGTKLLSPLVNGLSDVGHPPMERLSERELQVLELLGQALETRQIAETLKVSVKTVETYREHLKVKLNLDNSAQLIRRAVEWAHIQRRQQTVDTSRRPFGTKPKRDSARTVRFLDSRDTPKTNH